MIHEMKPRHSAWFSVKIRPKLTEYIINVSELTIVNRFCAAGFALLNLPKGKSLGRSKPETNSYAQALATHCVGFLLYPSSAELPYAK